MGQKIIEYLGNLQVVRRMETDLAGPGASIEIPRCMIGSGVPKMCPTKELPSR